MLKLSELNMMMARGSALLEEHDPETLFQVASKGRTYVEIGTHWGGSAIVAGLAGCEVHCIDPWESTGNLLARPGWGAVQLNWKHAGLDPRKLFIHKQKHPPWPEAIKYQNFEIGLIDGDHAEESVRLDWEAMKIHITKYVLFHDVVAYVDVQKVYREAAQEWEVWEGPYMSQFGVVRRIQ
ncbi:hypothetical protein LCGC14_0572770 [marine sediment metagenome]|uniref:Class I SAM-dependent methyltransferase n=1 Tax=marine sediment metagenome TaxID=412755 RepID=A0A0F9U508_9ZZZZ